MTNQKLFQEFAAKLSEMNYIHAQEIPNIDLYMDQLTTFMDTHLGGMKRYNQDKILTKTMINNYTKNDLLPPPVKKKYSKDHMLLLIFIYYFKSFLSITDIQEVLEPLIKEFVPPSGELNLEKIYSEIFSFEKEEMGHLKQDIQEKFNLSQTAFQNAETDQKELLQRFTFICMLGFDIYLKKQMIQTMLDSLKKQEE